MSDERIININAQAARQGIEGHEERIVELENQIRHIVNQQQTLINMVTELQKANTLALQQLRGRGSTSHGDVS